MNRYAIARLQSLIDRYIKAPAIDHFDQSSHQRADHLYEGLPSARTGLGKRNCRVGGDRRRMATPLPSI